MIQIILDQPQPTLLNALSKLALNQGNTMKSNPIAWFEIYVQDMSRAKAFYEAVFQTTLTSLKNPDPNAFTEMEMWTFPSSMESYGACGALVKMAGCPSGGGGTLVYFACDDCAVEAARVATHGGKVVNEKMSIGEHGFIALVSDTEGNTIGLYSMQ
jgi:predicted enzyme related to lactoylglutathione lyase